MTELALRPIQVYALPPIWGTPSPSPFVIKLYTWLRMAGLPYETPPLKGRPASRTGKIPYVRLSDGRELYDSTLIIETLAQERGVDLDAALDPHRRALGHVLRRTIEEGTYFCGAWERWFGAGAQATRRDYFLHLPALARPLVATIAARGMRTNLHGQGTGRHRPEDIRRFAAADLDAVAELFEGPYVLGEPSSVDATVFAFLWGWSAGPFATPLRERLQQHPELVAYAERMRARWFPEFPAIGR